MLGRKESRDQRAELVLRWNFITIDTFSLIMEQNETTECPSLNTRIVHTLIRDGATVVTSEKIHLHRSIL